MERITKQMLECQRDYIAELLGKPNGAAWQRINGENVATVGKLCIEPGSQAYGRWWKLAEICNEAGGERIVCAGKTARDMRAVMEGFIEGICYARNK